MSELDELRKSASAVFIGCDETVAEDLSKKLLWAADKIEKLKAVREAAEQVLKRNCLQKYREILQAALDACGERG